MTRTNNSSAAVVYESVRSAHLRLPPHQDRFCTIIMGESRPFSDDALQAMLQHHHLYYVTPTCIIVVLPTGLLRVARLGEMWRAERVNTRPAR